MKYILFIIVLFLFSCEKDTPEPEYCWKCNITSTYKSPGYQPVVKIDSLVKCYFTEREIKLYISIKTEPAKLIIDNKQTTIESIYTCKKR